MTKRCHHAVVLVIAALGILTFVASAQAENVWRVLGKQLSAEKEVSATPSKEVKLVVAAKGTEFRCPSMELASGLLLTEGKSSATVLFKECTTYLSGTLSKDCAPQKLIAAKVKGALISHSAEFFELVAPAEGSTFTTLKFSEPCPLPDEVPITGSLVLQCIEALCESEQSTHVFQEASAGLFKSDGLEYMGSPAELVGSATAELSDSDKGSKWSGGPPPPPPEEDAWRVEGGITSSTVEVTGEVDKAFTLSFELSFNTRFKVTCKSLAVSDGLLLVGGTSVANVELSNCTSYINEKEKPACKPKTPIEFGMKGDLLLHAGAVYELFSPREGSTFAVWNFGPICSIASEVAIGGSFVMACEACEEEAVTHLFQGVPHELFVEDSIGLGFGGPGVIEGGFTLSLTGKDKGKKWSGLS